MEVPQDLEQRLIRMIATSKKLPADTITRDTTFDALAIDSLDKINLSFDIEEAFSIAIPDSAIGSIRTVGDMIDGVRNLITAKA